MAELLRLEAVSLVRDHRRILDHLDWTIHSGQHWAVLGPNGSGKTTLLNIVNGYLWPTEGRVQVLGETFGETDLRDLRQRLGWVSASLIEQITRYHSEMPAIDVVMSGIEASIGLYRAVADEVRVQAVQLLRWLDIEHLKTRPFGVLSQGERQRVVLARAWLATPELLILDEPTAGLDLVARERLLDGLTRLVKASPSPPGLIYVTHQIDEVLPWFTHVLLLREGGVVAQGEKHHVLDEGALRRTFDLPVQVVWRKDRPWLTLS